MIQPKQILKSTFIALLGTFLFSTSSCSVSTKNQEVADYLKKTNEVHSIDYGTTNVLLLYPSYGGKGGIAVVIDYGYTNETQNQVIMVDFAENGLKRVDLIYKPESAPILLTYKEMKKFEEIYKKIIAKFHSKINPEPKGDWIGVLEKTLKDYYQEKEEMQELIDILKRK